MYKVDNAIIMAAGTSSRFAPLSFEKPKALFEVKGEVLIERQIKQLLNAGINEIIIIVGYKKEEFYYLKDKYGIVIVENNDYLTRNNNASIKVAEKYLKNSYICSADNYFGINPFKTEEEESFYSVLYSKGYTNEWCISLDDDGNICKVTVGGKDSWYMLGHVFWSEKFSKKFIEILNNIYDIPETANKLWEDIYIENLVDLKMKIKKYSSDAIYEFDTLDELRIFDTTYINNTRSQIIKDLAQKLNVLESEIINVESYKSTNLAAAGFMFNVDAVKYKYDYETRCIEVVK